MVRRPTPAGVLQERATSGDVADEVGSPGKGDALPIMPMHVDDGDQYDGQ